MPDNCLVDGFFTHDGKIIDKWEQYLAIYVGEFASFLNKGTPVCLLEIGVQNGGSLELWAKYLPAGSEITGLDIDPAVGTLTFENANIKAFVADINDAKQVTERLGEQTFDIIIDDGSHRSSDIIVGFETLFARLRAGGIYVVEDLHASYYPSHEGGFRLRSSSIEFFKDTADALNADYYGPWAKMEDAERARMLDLSRWLGRITFYDSVVVVQKLEREKIQPYRRFLSGGSWEVVNPVDGLLLAPPIQLHSMLVGEATAQMIDMDLGTRIGSLSASQSELGERERLYTHLKNENSELIVLLEINRSKISSLETSNLNLTCELNLLKRRFAELDAEIIRLRRDRRGLLDEQDSLKSDQAKLESEITLLSQSLKYVQLDNDRLRSRSGRDLPSRTP